jgi:hypothetical protein
MAMNTDIDTSDLVRVDPPAMRVLPPLDAGRKSPFYIAQFPISNTVSADTAKNFAVNGIPSYRISPPVPLSMSGAGVNAVPTVTAAPILRQPIPSPTIASPLVGTPTGYSFAFNEVRLPLSSGFQIASYKIYRGPSNDSSQASVIQTCPHSVNGLSTPVEITDPQPNVQLFNIFKCYFVSAVATNGRESTLTPAQSGLVSTTKSGFNPNGQLASTFHNQPVNSTFTPLAGTTLSSDGSATAVTVGATQIQFGSGIVTYNSATVDRGSFGTSYVTGLDPQFSGGSIPFLISATNFFQSTSDGLLPFGKINTASASSSSGGGTGAGTAGSGAGARGITL